MTLRFERYFSIVFFLVLEVFFYHKSYLKCYSISSTSLDPLFYISIHLPVMYAIRYYYLYISCLWILPLHWSSTLKEITEEIFSQAYIKMDRWWNIHLGCQPQNLSKRNTSNILYNTFYDWIKFYGNPTILEMNDTKYYRQRKKRIPPHRMRLTNEIHINFNQLEYVKENIDNIPLRHYWKVLLLHVGNSLS